MPAHPILAVMTVAAAVRAPAAFSMDRVLACGPSAAWLEAGWSTAPVRRSDLAWRPAPITGFIEPG
jgi:hypothetical protein